MRQLLQETQHEAGLASDEITKVLIDDRLKRGLFEHAVTVAASSQNHAKITLLAKVLGRALTSTDDPRIDRADLLIGMIAQLEQPHVEVLAVMASEAHPGGRTAWPQFAIADKRPNMSQILSPLLKRLEGLGLIEDTITGGTTTQETRHLSAWVFTSFGQDLVTFLRSMPIDDESTQPLADQELGADED